MAGSARDGNRICIFSSQPVQCGARQSRRRDEGYAPDSPRPGHHSGDTSVGALARRARFLRRSICAGRAPPEPMAGSARDGNRICIFSSQPVQCGARQSRRRDEGYAPDSPRPGHHSGDTSVGALARRARFLRRSICAGRAPPEPMAGSARDGMQPFPLYIDSRPELARGSRLGQTVSTTRRSPPLSATRSRNASRQRTKHPIR